MFYLSVGPIIPSLVKYKRVPIPTDFIFECLDINLSSPVLSCPVGFRV